jgi:membrane-associated phospholipid phosphatase
MEKLLKENRYFFIPYLFFLLISSTLLIVFSKAELHILINKDNNSFFDTFFKYLTNLGDGAFIGILFLILLLKKLRYAFAFLAGSLFSSVIIVNLFKKVLLHDMYRPAKYFELFETYKLHLVDGIKIHALQSFPSGHSATAFNLFFMLTLLVKNNLLKFIFSVLAILIAFSRVYLSQHFLIDITAGSVLGVVFILIAWLWFEKINVNWLDQSLLNVFKTK